MKAWPQLSIDTEKSPTMCFVCGRDNPIGLKLTFRQDNKTVRAEFTPGEFHQGWSGIVHGGIIECLLDEALTYAPYFEGISCVTARMEVRIKRPAMIDEPLIITGSITKKTRKLIDTRAAISLKDGTLVAEGTATMFVFHPEREEVRHKEGRLNSNSTNRGT